MAGSNRFASRSCKARHSLSERAKTPGGSNCCRRSSTASTVVTGQPRRSATSASALAEIAGLVDQVDQMQTDQALGPRRQVQLQLFDQVVPQALRLAQARLEIGARFRKIEPAAAPGLGEAADLQPARQVVALRVRPAVLGRFGAASGRLTDSPSRGCP